MNGFLFCLLIAAAVIAIFLSLIMRVSKGTDEDARKILLKHHEETGESIEIV